VNLAITLAAFIIALGSLIVVHEFGHYLVARLAGVKVLRFSIGFGRPLIQRRFGHDNTEWILAAMPFGGYVKMLDEREGAVEPNEVERAFNRKSVGRRIAIVAAGPLANLLFAVFLYFGIYIGGVQDVRPKLSAPPTGTPAQLGGLERGDMLRKINGEPVLGWQEARWKLLQLALERGVVELELIDAEQHLSWRHLDLRKFDPNGYEDDPVARMGLRIFRPDAVIGRSLPGSIAERAGLRSGDRIVAVNGRLIVQWDEFVQAVRSGPGEKLLVTVRTGTRDQAIVLVPEAVPERGRTIGRIGAEPDFNADRLKETLTIVRYSPPDAFRLALSKTWDTAIFSIRMIGKMLVGEVSWRNLSGPVTIADYAGQSAQAGWASYLAFLAIISVSLGVLNLLPIPILDGGHLMYYLLELFKGSPVSEKMMEMGQRFGLSVLIFLMAFAFYNDINRLIAG